MKNNKDNWKNLISLLKMFKNRPYHLAKFLKDNEALTDKFIQEVLNSSKLNNIVPELEQEKSLNFKTISEMEDYFSSLFNSSEIKNKTVEQIEQDLNSKLDELINQEKYEEAASIRDYMYIKGYKRRKF